MTTLSGFSENPQDITQELSKQEQLLEEEMKEVRGKTGEKITQEQFNNMSWEDVKNNIRLDNDNKITLFDKPLSYWLLHVYWSPDKSKGLEEFRKEKTILERFKKQFEQKELLINILQVWIPEAQKQSQVWFKWARQDDDIIESNISKINKLINNFGVPVDDNIFKAQIENIFYLMEVCEEQEDIIGGDDLKKVKEVFLNEKLTNEKKQIQIFNAMRYGGWSGNSEGVKNVIADKLLETEEFKDENEILENLQIREYLEDNNLEKLRDLLGFYLANKMSKIYKKVKIKIDKGIKHEVEELNKNKKELEIEINLESYLKDNKKDIENSKINATLDVFKHVLIRKKIEKENRGEENSSLNGIYANMVGLGETKLGDFVTIGDDNIDLAIDFASTIAIGAITMGAGIGAIALTKGLIMSARVVSIGNKAAKGLRIANYLEKGTKIRAISGFIGSSTLEGVSFYEGATIMQNIIFRDLEILEALLGGDISLETLWKSLGEVGEGTLDTKELIKNIAFMGALNSLRFLSKIPGMGKIMSFEAKIPDEYLKPGNIKKVLEGTGNLGIHGFRDGSIMFGISGITDKLVGEDWHPTVREYLEFITLIQLMTLKDIGRKK